MIHDAAPAIALARVEYQRVEPRTPTPGVPFLATRAVHCDEEGVDRIAWLIELAVVAIVYERGYATLIPLERVELMIEAAAP